MILSNQFSVIYRKHIAGGGRGGRTVCHPPNGHLPSSFTHKASGLFGSKVLNSKTTYIPHLLRGGVSHSFWFV